MEDSKELTPFNTPLVHFSFKKMSFDISGTPFTFQYLINSVFSDLLGNSVYAFLDDIIIVSPDVYSHFQRLEDVLNRLKAAGITLKLSKCNFLRKQITLEHKLDSAGVHTTNEKVEAVRNFPLPVNLKDFR